MPVFEVSAGVAALLIFGTWMVLMLTGTPIIFSMGFTAILYLFLLMGPNRISIIDARAWDAVDNPLLLSLPMFILMGLMLEQSGVASNLYDMMHKWFGGLRGGLAVGTVLICMLMAAMTGLSAAATVTMGLTALPEMLKRGYQKSIALGCIGAGGALGILIPPSVPMIIYALITGASIGQLFIAGILPGIMLGSLYIVYILVRSWLQPNIAPAIPVEERASWREKGRALVHVLLPILIVIMVLGSIYGGLATPTEAAGLGVIGTIIAAAVNRTLNKTTLKGSCYSTAKVCGMMMWMFIGTFTIKTLVFDIGAGKYIEELFTSLPGGVWGPIIAIQIIWIIMGCMIDAVSILFITGPIFFPIVQHAGFDMVWFGIVYIVNMEMAYLTPPFGMNLFYLKGVAPRSVTMADIIKSIGPFVSLQLLGLVIVMVFPQLALWLPSKMLG